MGQRMSRRKEGEQREDPHPPTPAKNMAEQPIQGSPCIAKEMVALGPFIIYAQESSECPLSEREGHIFSREGGVQPRNTGSEAKQARE